MGDQKFEIKPEQRQSWQSIAAIWAGGMICVPCLMIGGVLSGGGLSIPEIIISILLGYGLICAYMIFIGMQACDTGLPVSVLASGALGEKGSRYIISILLAIACIGWFGIQSATCGAAFASMLASMLHIEATAALTTVSSLIWGFIMLATACAGFKGLKWLNYVAVPLLVIVCLYGLIAGIVKNDGGAAIAAYAPEMSAGLVFGISMVVASFALGGVISADYCRFAKSRSDVVKSSIIGVIPAGLFMLITGALMSIVTGQYDISAILTSLGVPILGLIALVFATWTTNVTNAYSGGLALSNLLGFDESKFKLTTGIAGKRQKRKLQDQKWILCTRCHSVSCRGSFCVYHGWNICKFPRPYRGSTIPEYAVFCRSGKWNCCIVCVVYSPFQNGRRKEINKAGGGFFFEEN